MQVTNPLSLSQGQHRSTPPAKTKASDNTDDEEIIQLGEPPDPPATDAYRILGHVNSPEHTAMSHIHRVFMHTVGKKFRVELTRQVQRDSVDFQVFILEFLKGEVGGDLTMDVAKLVIATEVSLRFNVITIDTGHFADLYVRPNRTLESSIQAHSEMQTRLPMAFVPQR